MRTIATAIVLAESGAIRLPPFLYRSKYVMNVVVTLPRQPWVQDLINDALGGTGLTYCESSLRAIEALKPDLLITDENLEWAGEVKEGLGIDVVCIDGGEWHRPAVNGVVRIGRYETDKVTRLSQYATSGVKLVIQDVDLADAEALRSFVVDDATAVYLSETIARITNELVDLRAKSSLQNRISVITRHIHALGGSEEMLTAVELLLGLRLAAPIEQDMSRVDPHMQIEELGLSRRVYKCLKKVGLNTVADLVEADVWQYRNIRNFGHGAFVEVVTKLAALNLTIKGWRGSIEAAWPSPYKHRRKN